MRAELQFGLGGGVDNWATYELWNEAIATVVFPELSDPVPAYLDLEEDVLAAIAAEVGFEGDPREGLTAAVRAVTVTGASFSLGLVWRAEVAWRGLGRSESAPPCLAFLALSALAAEDMGSSTDGFDQADYYSRLCVLLGLSHQHHGVRQQYMSRAEALWADLNRWLESLDGLRGTPTAYALSYRYVGLPLSQALVREGDRRKFPHFFAQYGLAAGMELAPEVLERYLDAWFGHEACPASSALRSLWSKQTARERIAMVAAVELVGWDGALPEGQAGESAPAFQRVSLMAQVRQGFLGSNVDIALTVRSVRSDEFDGRMEVEAASGEWLPLTLTPVVANLWRTSFTGGLDVNSVLEGVVKIRPSGDDSAGFRHYPRSVVPLIFDEMQSAFVEQERLQLNVDSMLLLRVEARGKPLAAQVVEALKSCARPGFRVQEKLDGLPEGWVLVTDVQLFGAPTSGQYNELVPLARDQLTIAGGMRIPSRIRKWSAVAAPEIRASVESAPSLRLVLTDLETDKVVTWSKDGGALVVSLEQLMLPVGDYRAALYAGASKDPLQQATIRLRSADGVDSGWYLVPNLTYDLSDPVGALTASEPDPDDPPPVQVSGAVSFGSNGVQTSLKASAKLVWSDPKPSTTSMAPVRIGSPDPKSCVVTGAHHLEFPTFYGGWQPKYIEGVCKYCGLVKRSPGWIRNWQGPVKRGSQVAHVEVAELPAIDGSSGRLWDAALDSLMHLGGGGAAAMSTLASQIDGSALFTSAFPTSLELLGHVAVERNSDGTAARWEISPTCLAAVPEGLELVGFWPDQRTTSVAQLLEGAGGRLRESPASAQPTRRWFEGVSATEAAELLTEEPVAVVESATTMMLEALPRLSDVAASLPREPMPGFEKAERYEVSSSTWLPTNDVARSGAFRLTRGFERLYLFRADADVTARSCARGSAQLVKHLAANELGAALASYLASRQLLIVPRGCGLPGLYGRAAVMASGQLPSSATVKVGEGSRACISYPSIPHGTADLLVTLLSS